MNDKEGRKWLLQKLYDKGLKYIVFDSVLGRYFGVDKIPAKNGVKWNYYGVRRFKIGLITDLIPDFNAPNCLDIGKYLGGVDWSKVAVDTPIKIERGNGIVVNRHFATFDNGKVCYYQDGRTSWSNVGTKIISSKNVKLAGGDDEN